VKESGEGNLEVEASEYKMLPVVLIVPRGSPQSAFDQRKKEAEALRERVTSCADAGNYFKTMQSAAVRDIVTKTSADLAPSLRDMLEKTTIGHLTPPETTKQGVEMVALCARNKTTIDTPKKKEMRDKMFVQKYEAKSKSYLQEVRKAAMIEYR
jgi:peptidyl-prolyl cis-trans isomerase SurA